MSGRPWTSTSERVASPARLAAALGFVVALLWPVLDLVLRASAAAPPGWAAFPRALILAWNTPLPTGGTWGQLELGWVVQSLGVVAATLTVSLPAGYTLARVRFPGRRVVLSALVLGVFAPAALALGPEALLLHALGLAQGHVGVGLAQLGVTLPPATWIVWRGFELQDPRWEEMARLAGASRWTLFTRVSVPLARAAIAASAAVSFGLSFGTFAVAVVVLPDAPSMAPAAALADRLAVESPAILSAWLLLFAAPALLVGPWVAPTLAALMAGARTVDSVDAVQRTPVPLPSLPDHPVGPP